MANRLVGPKRLGQSLKRSLDWLIPLAMLNPVRPRTPARAGQNRGCLVGTEPLAISTTAEEQWPVQELLLDTAHPNEVSAGQLVCRTASNLQRPLQRRTVVMVH